MYQEFLEIVPGIPEVCTRDHRESGDGVSKISLFESRSESVKYRRVDKRRLSLCEVGGTPTPYRNN